jgi:hypothetical protein
MPSLDVPNPGRNVSFDALEEDPALMLRFAALLIRRLEEQKHRPLSLASVSVRFANAPIDVRIRVEHEHDPDPHGREPALKAESAGEGMPEQSD